MSIPTLHVVPRESNALIARRAIAEKDEGWQKHLTWRSIFDCKLPLNLAGVCQRARDNGYRFASYAGEIYFVSSRGMIEPTGLSASEVDL